MRKHCFCSWSGGKDSCLALFRAMEAGYEPKTLLTMFSLENQISTAHRLQKEIITAQAAAMNIESLICEASFDDYEKTFVENLKVLKMRGIDFGVFGDIDFNDNRQWEERVSEKAKIHPLLPLWQKDRKELVHAFLDLGFKAKIVVVNKEMLPVRFLGRDLSKPLLKEIEACGADVCGETGEYHSVVYDGPIFSHPLPLKYGTEMIPVGKSWAQIQVEVER